MDVSFGKKDNLSRTLHGTKWMDSSKGKGIGVQREVNKTCEVRNPRLYVSAGDEFAN